jgi:hypothetical protein
MKRDESVLSVDYIPSTNEFLGGLGIKPKGLGSQLFKSVYEQFFVWSVDLRQEYEKYYCVEYQSFRHYLEVAHEIYLDPKELEKKHILEIGSLSGVVDQMYDSNSFDAVIACIKKLEASREN